MHNIVVCGGPGNGKTTLARTLAARRGIEHIELDSLFHVTDFGSESPAAFRAALIGRMQAAPNGWVMCGNYVSILEHLHIEQADTLVFLDLPKRVVMARVVRRTLRRVLTRERLYGNEVRESFDNLWRWDPEKNIIRWTWVNHRVYRQRTPRLIASPE